MKATIENLLADLRDESPLIPYQLHEGLNQLTSGFGIGFKECNQNCADFLEQYMHERLPDSP